MKPVAPDMKHPAKNASVRNRPDAKKLNASDPSGRTTAVDVTKTMMPTGIVMTAIVFIWRLR
jgi:hypothetical protein